MSILDYVGEFSVIMWTLKSRELLLVVAREVTMESEPEIKYHGL